MVLEWCMAGIGHARDPKVAWLKPEDMLYGFVKLPSTLSPLTSDSAA